MRYREITPDAAKQAEQAGGRKFLEYLVNCALPEDEGVYLVVDGQRLEFPGGMGLAPGWLERPLTETEQRWVSAGILARTNFFGVKVPISLRRPGSGFAFLEVSSEETRGFSIYEGDFFGNLFIDPPIACVAAPPRTPGGPEDGVFQLRVGTEPDPSAPPLEGLPLTRCGFVLTGRPQEPGAHCFRGVCYDEYISVYLKPAGS